MSIKFKQAYRASQKIWLLVVAALATIMAKK